MIGLLQRVAHANVVVDEKIVGEIEQGILVLVGICKQDDEAKADRLLDRLLNYRVFEDENGKMNLSTVDIQGGLLLVPQFTLPADTTKGTRASFTKGASPKAAAPLFDYIVSQAHQIHKPVANGIFAADMKVSLLNDGPVTFWLEV